MRAEFLCSSDCVAEEERFELSVRFCRAKARRVRKLQIAKSCQRISPEIRHQNWAISSVSIRHLFVRDRRRQGDSVARMVTLRGPQATRWGSQATACLPRSPKAKNLSAGSAPRKANNGNFQRFLVMLCDETSASRSKFGDFRLSDCRDRREAHFPKSI